MLDMTVVVAIDPPRFEVKVLAVLVSKLLVLKLVMVAFVIVALPAFRLERLDVPVAVRLVVFVLANCILVPVALLKKRF